MTTDKPPDPKPIRCPRCGSERVRQVRGYSNTPYPGWKKCDWCGMQFLVNEQGEHIE